MLSTASVTADEENFLLSGNPNNNPLVSNSLLSSTTSLDESLLSNNLAPEKSVDMLSSHNVDNLGDELLSNNPVALGSDDLMGTMDTKDFNTSMMLFSNIFTPAPEEESISTFEYVYDDTIANKLDYTLEVEISSGITQSTASSTSNGTSTSTADFSNFSGDTTGLSPTELVAYYTSSYNDNTANDLVIKNYTYHSSMPVLQQNLNNTVASIYDRYIQETVIPLKDPLWLIAIGSVEYSYTSNDSDLIFSFPANMSKAASNPNYLLSYDWREVEDSFGRASVLRRDGSSIGILQITAGFASNVEPVIPADFGRIGAGDTPRTDVWVTLGACTDSGSSIIWKHGIDGDRWSPADNANITYAVFDRTIKNSPTCMDAYEGKYEQAIILMWGHNRGTGIIGQQSYIDRTKVLATYVPEMIAYIEQEKPSRFIRTTSMSAKVTEIANKATNGDKYPVMALMSYLITEARYSGRW